MFSYLEEIVLSFANGLPLEVFVFVASFIEEVVAPIPSPAVMLLAGSIARLDEQQLVTLIPLALLGAFGKTIGAFVVYKITESAEDVVMHKFGKFFGVTLDDVERFGKKIGKGKRDYFYMTLLRALPFIPSVVISVGSGVLKVPLRLFLITTFLGTIIRDGIYLYAGYVSAVALKTFISTSTHIETYVEVAVFLVLVYFLAKLLHRRWIARTNSTPL